MRIQLNRLFPAIFLLCLACPVSPFAAEQKLSKGEVVFIRECAKCHQTGPGARNKIGPRLSALFGRPAGTLEGYRNFSDAMRNAGFVWTRENFREFIREPKIMMMGTTQIYPGLKDEQSISALIDYLETR